MTNKENVMKYVVSLRKLGYKQKEIAQRVKEVYGLDFSQRTISQILCNHELRSVKAYKKPTVGLKQLNFIEQEPEQVEKVEEKQEAPQVEPRTLHIFTHQSLALLERVLNSDLPAEDKIELTKTITQLKGA